MNHPIAIIGAGLSGIFLRLHLLKAGFSDAVLWLEQREQPGGLAYSTSSDTLRLNAPAEAMSWVPEKTQDFSEWLSSQNLSNPWPLRRDYQSYLKSSIHFHEIPGPTQDIIQEIRYQNSAFQLLGKNQSYKASTLILATGYQHPSIEEQLKDIPSKASVSIMGTALGMLDAVALLNARSHQGKITAFSRHGLLPLEHQTVPEEVPPSLQDFPNPLEALRYFRANAHHHQPAIALANSLRSITPQIWGQWTFKSQKQFLCHLQSYWDRIRHKAPEQNLKLIQTLCESGQMRVIKGRFVSHENQVLTLNIRGQLRTIASDFLIDCTSPKLLKNPLLKHLIQKDWIQEGPHQLGLMTKDNGHCLPGRFPIYAIGPLRRETLYESTAAQEIRIQAQKLARELLS